MAPSTTARCMRPLVPFFKPGSTECNLELRASASPSPSAHSSKMPPTTVQVRNWDHATGVFKNPVTVVVKEAPAPTPALAPCEGFRATANASATATKCRARAKSEERSGTTPVNANAKLLTPAAIRARNAQEQETELQATLQHRPQPQVRHRAPAQPQPQFRPHGPAQPQKSTQRKSKPARSPRAQSPPQERTIFSESTENTCSTPVRKPYKRRALSLSPALPPSQPQAFPFNQKRASIDIPSSASVVIDPDSRTNACSKFAGSTFDAASPDACSFPIPRLYAKNYNVDGPPDDAPRRMLPMCI